MRSKALFLLASLLFLATAAHAGLPGYYGPAVAMDGLGNLTIGPNGQIAVRFLCTHTGGIDRIVQQYQNVTPGYMGGTGGRIKWELRTDDGTANHFPSGTVLWTVTDTSPTKAKSGTVIQWFDLSPAVPVTAGTLYHVVYTNVDPSPDTNYVSFDGIYTKKNNSPVQPAYSDTNLMTLWNGPNWIANLHTTPEFNVHYADGYAQGTGYVDSTSTSSPASETFTVSGGNVVVTGVSAAGTGLSFSLTSGGQAIASGTGSPGAYAGWTTYTFPSSITLVNGQTYTLTLSGSVYRALQKGDPYGMYTSFPDGHWTANAAYDLEFYFTTVAASSEPPPTGLQVTSASGTQVTLGWSAPSGPAPAGYKVYRGTASGTYTSNVDVKNVLQYTVQGLSPGTTSYFAVTDYDSTGTPSAYSNEVSYTLSPACTYSITPASQTVAASGGSGAVNVTAQGSTCSWNVSGIPSWIAVGSGGSGTGNGTVNYTVAANGASSSRTVGLTVAGRTFTVTQGAATAASYTIASSAGYGGTVSPSGAVQVGAGADISFSVSASGGYAIGSVVVDGANVGSLSSYTFHDVTSNHTISATFRRRW